MQAVNGVNNANYAMNIATKQNAPATEDYSNMPMVYEQVPEPKKSSNVVGMTLLGIGGLGLGYLFGKRMGSKAADEAVQALEVLQNSEAVKNYETLKKATDEITKVVENKKWYKPNTWGVTEKVKEILAPVKEQAAKAKEEAAKVVDDVAKAADDTTTKA